MSRLGKWWRQAWENIHSPRRLVLVPGDSLPDQLPRRDLILARDGDEDWCVGMICPCGCQSKIELLVIEEAKPRWDVHFDNEQRPTLSPSVWLKTGCRSHFLVRKGRVVWCG